MKNVAKCDTWCELQNPVNHRVFECKLCPKPFGRGHICLGVTHHCPPNSSSGRAKVSLPCVPTCSISPKASPQQQVPRQSVVFLPSFLVMHASSPKHTLLPLRVVASTAFPTRPQVRRDYPLSLSISISEGKETYKDSPSNGEQTGNDPA